jgi:riboflavin kinase/FMN adenylyltransferase
LKIYHKLKDISNIKNPVASIGMFDGVHLGHKQIFEKLTNAAKDIGGESVAISFDTHPRMVLQHDAYKLKFINSYQEKINLIESMGVDHLVFLPFTREFSQQTTADFVKNILVDILKIKILIIGYDNRFGNKENNNFDELFKLSKEYNFDIIQSDVKFIGNNAVSSTKIREALDKGEIKLANQLLGYQYQLSGKVVMGNQIGQKIGFPTANIDLDNDFKLIPSIGVYAILIEYQNVTYKGMLNIGIRPTLNINKLSIEAHIFGFNIDLYGQYIKVLFVDKIRDEQRFNGLDELVIQLQKDKISSMEILK